MNYKEAEQYVHSLLPRGSRLGLPRITELCKRLGNPEKKLRFVHVVGTNGKGSVAVMTSNVLYHAGYQVGLFTSPFIMEFRERIRVNGEPYPEKKLAKAIYEVKQVSEGMEEPPTEFEFVTALAFKCFYEAGCEIVVLEAGIGGELDSTNVIPAPLVAVLTTIGLDHTEILGDTIEEITRTKAGIIKEACPVVYTGDNEAALTELRGICEEKGSRLFVPDLSDITVKNITIKGTTVDFYGYEDLFISLIGAHQAKNAAVVITVVELLREKGYEITDRALRSGLSDVSWPARLEVLRENPPLLFDGAHNPNGAKTCQEALRALFPDEKITFLMGVMADKDVEGILDELSPVAERFICVTPNNLRSLDAESLCEKIRKTGVTADSFDTVYDAVEELNKCKTPGVAVGSLYLYREFRLAWDKLNPPKKKHFWEK